MLPNKEYDSGYAEKRDTFREGGERDSWDEEVSHELYGYCDHCICASPKRETTKITSVATTRV